MNTDQVRSWHAQGMSGARDVPHLCDEIDRLRAVLAGIDQERLLSRWYQDRAEKAEAAIARVRALHIYRPADFHESEPVFGVHEVLRALDGAK